MLASFSEFMATTGWFIIIAVAGIVVGELRIISGALRKLKSKKN